MQSISLFKTTQSEIASSHSYLLDIIEKVIPESDSSSPSKFLIEISQLEDIATVLSVLIKNDDKLKEIIDAVIDSSNIIFKTWDNLKILRHEMQLFQSSYEKDFASINKIIKQITCVHKEFKARCQSNFLDYLKGVDIDLRKILKPLVPTTVVREQVKFPLINTNSSLCSSIQSVEEPKNEISEDASATSQPDPSEVTVQKLNAHIQMLVGTLENIAKDLMLVLAEADREYYQLLDKQDVYSRPPTPLAAPLPDYFCFELQDTQKDTHYKQIITTETKETWVKRLNKLYKKNEIKDSLFKSLLLALEKSNETRKLDLREIFINTETSITERENLIYYLINGSTEFENHVSIAEMMSEEKLKPEPPKEPKPKGKHFHKFEKEGDKRASPVNSPDLEVARISRGLIPQKDRVISSIRLISKSPKIERLFRNRKSVRVRSITPIGKEKINGLKARTPSMQNNKVSLSSFYAKHRIKHNL